MKNSLQNSVECRLRYVRAGTGKKQKEIARELSEYLSEQQTKDIEIKQQALSFYETGRRKIPLLILKAYSQLYGVRLVWLQEGTGDISDPDKANYDLEIYAHPLGTATVRENSVQNADENNIRLCNNWFEALTPCEQIGLIFKAAVTYNEKDIRALISALDVLLKRME